MNESLLRGFCESRHRKLIVAIVTSLSGLAVLVPLSDEYFDNREHRRELVEELDRARQTERELPKFTKQVAELAGEVAVLQSRTVTESSSTEYRNKLVATIREAGCQMRKLDLGAPTRRAWTQDDHPLQTTTAPDKKTPFQLERRKAFVSVDGSMGNIHQLLEKLEQDATLAYPQKLLLTSGGGSGESASLEMELWLFALSR